MIELGKNQTRKVMEYCEQYFLCVIDKDKKALLTYSFMPYLKVENGEVKFNVEKFNEDVEFVGGYDLIGNSSQIKNANEYLEMVKYVRDCQTILFNVESVREFIIQNSDLFSNEIYDQVDTISDSLEKYILDSEKVFNSQVIHQVPSNWAYEMFDAPNWTEDKTCSELFKMTQGEITKPATSIGYSYEYLEYLLSDNRKLLTEIFVALDEMVKKLKDLDY